MVWVCGVCVCGVSVKFGSTIFSQSRASLFAIFDIVKLSAERNSFSNVGAVKEMLSTLVEPNPAHCNCHLIYDFD